MPQRALEARDAVGVARPACARQPDAGVRASLRLRAPEPRVIPALVELINAAYKPRDWWLFEQLRTSEEGFLHETGKPGAQSIVGEIDGRPVAHVVLWLQDDGAWIGMLATAVEQQGRGIATVLVEEAERRARAAGYSELRLDCVRENGMPAYSESLGFLIEREERGRGHTRTAADEWTRVYMRKRLGDV
jgi:ribosomal protein S18 acetylase RimI-like enzyme